jgi:hypothetical protein
MGQLERDPVALILDRVQEVLNGYYAACEEENFREV